MGINGKQTLLGGIGATMHTSSLTDAIFQLIDKHGLTTLAEEVEIDKATLSRFRSGEVGLTLKNMERLLKYGDVVLISKDRYRRLVDTIITLSELTKEGLGL
jgi:DNA-binding Xre family transcriptional regulator